MGRAKEWMMEQEARGYSAADGDICADCVTDAYLAEWITDNAAATECSFCGRECEDAFAADFDAFVGVVLAGIAFDWNHPDDEGISYITAEGGYQATITDSWEVVWDYEISENQKVVDEIIETIDTKGWVERDYYVGGESQRLSSAWEWFKHVTKHQTRYLFLKSDQEEFELLPPSQMLDAIASVLKTDVADYDFIETITPNEDIIRIRIDDLPHSSAARIGPPPIEFATQSNRMSPAGVPMFYGAYDMATAEAETFDPVEHVGQIMSIGTFRALRPLRLVDLAELPSVPSVFNPDRHHLIHPMRFLWDFARDIAKPIKRDGREHIAYVPTQIVTEYFRRVFRDADGQPIDGLIYRSSRHDGAKAFVLFCENDQCAEADHSGAIYNRLLKITAVEHRQCPPVAATDGAT
jgi:hypothetical protein